MLSESLIIGLVVLLLCGAVSFYMYVRVMFLEKKVSVMESILVDVRVALDSVMMENRAEAQAVPISHTPGAQLSAPAPLDPSESETIPEENFYSSVLEQAHEKDSELVEGGVTAEKALESFTDEALPIESAAAVGPNYEAMTKQELTTLAESKGLRVKRSANRADVLALLRRANPAQNDSVSTGAENVPGSAGNTLQAGAPLDGGLPVDVERNGSELEASV